MPELPEVETTVNDLSNKIIGCVFIDVWTDFEKIIKKPKSFDEFKDIIKGKRIQKIYRRGKNILFDLSDKKTLLIHQKLTGHLLLGRWEKDNGVWRAVEQGALKNDPMNGFLRLIFWLNSGNMLALSDLRKFAKVELWDTDILMNSKEFNTLGINPIGKDFNFEKFKKALSKRKKGKIKQVLMDQKIIAGIGNIYSDEILWSAKVHPLKDVSTLSNIELKNIYLSMRQILKKAIKVKGESISDYRTIYGKKGGFDPFRMVYRRNGKPCPRCGTIIKRIIVGGRSAHFCPKCQVL